MYKPNFINLVLSKKLEKIMKKLHLCYTGLQISKWTSCFSSLFQITRQKVALGSFNIFVNLWLRTSTKF